MNSTSLVFTSSYSYRKKLINVGRVTRIIMNSVNSSYNNMIRNFVIFSSNASKPNAPIVTTSNTLNTPWWLIFTEPLRWTHYRLFAYQILKNRNSTLNQQNELISLKWTKCIFWPTINTTLVVSSTEVSDSSRRHALLQLFIIPSELINKVSFELNCEILL